MEKEKQTKTTAVPNVLLNDINLSAGEKITYILLMKYERFEKTNSGSFFTWSKDYISRKASKKYLESLLEKKYIDENNNFYYFEDGEKKDYNGQSFSTTFKTVSFFPVKEELLFAKYNERSLTSEQKLFLIFFDRDRCDTRQGWKPHFQTYEKYGLKKIHQIKSNLLEKGLISYEVRYYGEETKSLKQTFISKIKIAYLEDITETQSNKMPEAECIEVPKVEMCQILREAIEEEKESLGVIAIDDYMAYDRLDKKEHPEYRDMWNAYYNNEVYVM